MKKNKTKVIDERQETKLLEIGSSGFWIAFWILLAVMLVQMAIESIDMNIYIPSFAGEWLVFMIMCVYMGCRCAKNNIWEPKREPSAKANLVYSLVAGLVMGIMMFIIAFAKSGKIVGAIAAGVFIVAVIFGLCMAALSISAASYRRKKKKLEESEDEE